MAGEWIDWAPRMGRPAVGPDGALSGVKLRDGRELSPVPNETAWMHVGSSADIVAYRLA